MPRKSIRLILNRARLCRDGWLGHRLSYSDLSMDDKLFLASRYLSTIRKDPSRDPYLVYADVLGHWGVMCPHPPSRRTELRSGSKCGACGTYILHLRSELDLAAGGC